MPNDISDAFHGVLRTLKSSLDSLWDAAKKAVSDGITSALASLENDVKNLGPEALSIISTAVLSVASGGTSAFNPALNAALAALSKEGIIVAEHAVAGFVAGLIADLPTPSVPTPNVAPVPQG